MNNDKNKFRVWNDYEQCVDHRHPSESLIECSTGKAVAYNGFDGCLLEHDHVTVEQCTGLKDKNGKLIFEGDVCKFATGKSAETDIVKFSDIYAYFWCGNARLGATELEVIGNIHEHPELLK